MVRVVVIIFIIVLVVLGVGVFVGLREVRERAANKKEAAAISTSTEARAKGGGFFGLLRKDYISKDPFQRKESGFQLNRREDSGVVLSSSNTDASRESASGFVLRRDQSASSFNVISGGGTSSEAPSREPRPPFGFTKEQLSPLFDQVIINSLQYPRRSDYERTSIMLMAKTGLSRPINITGWKIKTNSGETLVPQAIERYVPAVSSSGDIILQAGQTLSLFGHYRFAEYQHPFGKNFRLNQCTGYLNSIYAFDPKLPEKCPRIDKDEFSSFSGACQTFLSTLYNCRVPTSAEINNFQGDAACQAFMRNKFGYGLCYNTHKNDENFLSNEWYAWLGKQIPFARDHDRVLLFDTSGLLVDEFSY
ncbi:MAG: hypothetical protein Q8R20_00015 [Nanoarchaeota archaeon]|nr:hypothetical protein [Nanoarchaeota archaeon]